MLYINAYIVSRCYGGGEEGGWWYDSGEPIASVPIPTEQAAGKDYFCQNGEVHTRDCHTCHGTGEVEKDDEYDTECGNDPPRTYIGRCEDCGQIPSDLGKCKDLISHLEGLLVDEVGRGQRLNIAVEKGMAEHYPQRTPRYE
jgi:hypothetical protein